MGVWTTKPNGDSVFRDDFPDTPEGLKAAQADTNQRFGSDTKSKGSGGGPSAPSAPQAPKPAPVGGAAQGTTYQTQWGDPRFQNPTAADKTRSIYDWGANENFGQYGQRVFGQGLKAYNPGMNPNSLENPLADTPYNQFMRNYYGEDIPADAFVAMMLKGDNDPYAPTMEQGIQQALGQRGQGTFQGGQQNLSNIANMVNQIAAGNTEGLSTQQREAGEEVMNSPSTALQLIMSQLHSTLGSHLGSRLAQRLQSSINDYYGNPVDNDPAKVGPWFTNALKKAGVIS